MNILEQIDQGAIEPVMVATNRLSADTARHVRTEVAVIDELDDEDPFWRDEGMTLWMWPSTACSTSSPALLAWDWVASESGVVARKTTTFCYSNIELLGPDGSPLDFPMHALMFTTVIHALPWQASVQREIARARTSQA